MSGLLTNPATIVAPATDVLQDIVAKLNALIGTIANDSNNLLSQVNAIQDVFQGKGVDAMDTAILRYVKAANASTGRLTQARDATKQFHGFIAGLSAEINPNTYHFADPFQASLAFDNLGDVNNVFNEGYLNMQAAMDQAFITLQQEGKVIDPLEGVDRQVLLSWVDALEFYKLNWRDAIIKLDVTAQTIPQVPGITPSPATIAQITSALSQGSSITAPTANETFISQEDYNAVIATYPDDPQTQACLFQMLQTPTGRQFATYVLYMGKKMGPDFIRWQHLGPKVGAVSHQGGYITMNLDDSMESNNDYIELSADMVHESVESYFAGAKGIRQMNKLHADYVAEWFQGKYNQEAGGDDQRSYHTTYSDWLNYGGGQGYVQGDDHSPIDIHDTDNPGYYWSPESSPINVGPIHLGDIQVDHIPNPMGLDPNMLVSNDLDTFPGQS